MKRFADATSPVVDLFFLSLLENVTITSSSSKLLKNGRRKSQEWVPRSLSDEKDHLTDNPTCLLFGILPEI